MGGAEWPCLACRQSSKAAVRHSGATALRHAAAVVLLGWGVAATPAAAADPAPEARLTAALARLDALAADIQKRSGVPGLALAVVQGDRVVHVAAYGLRQVGRPETVNPDTVFQLASLSKPIATTVLAGLVGQGRLTWDTPVRQHLPELLIGPAGVADAVTLRDLLSHRSGLPDNAGDDLEDLGFDRETVLERLRFLPIENRFRASYAYTNFGFTGAAEAAARQAGQPWEVLADQQLFRPLGMERTSASHAAWLAQPNRARLHVRRGDGWAALFERDPDAQSPAGGTSASVRDVARWMVLQLNAGRVDGRQLVAADALAETHRPQMVSRPPADPSRDRAGFYGLGWGVSYDDRGQVQLSHSGAFALGAATAVTLRPAEGLGIAVLTNGAPVGAPEALIASFLDLVRQGRIERDYLTLFGGVFAQLLAPTYTPPVVPERPLPPLPAAAVVGRYGNNYIGTAVVRQGETGLVLELGPQGTPHALTPVSGATFQYQPPGENAGGPSAVEFQLGPDGRATGMRIDNLDDAGQGRLRRLES
jgi:CubicO group peptidase (beta-lactamase class C family)